MFGRIALVTLVFAPLVAPGDAAGGQRGPLTFEVTFAESVRSIPFTGRVLVFLAPSKGEEGALGGLFGRRGGEPRRGYGWTTRRPLFSADVRDWAPGKPFQITEPRGYPHAIGELPAGRYRIQAVMHTNLDVPHSGTAKGNLYSKVVTAELDPAAGGSVSLLIDQREKGRTPRRSSPGVELVEFRSERMSRFFGRDVLLRAMVVLPEGYAESPDRRYPALYVIPSFGGDHVQAAGYSRFLGKFKTPFVRIGLDATSPHGHHVFADSDNCGPCGTALVKELIPHLETKYRLIRAARGRLLTGHSSGGWSSLWLQVRWPDFFGGTWSTSPDSVTFRDFCGIDLYDKKSNFYDDKEGEPRPIIRGRGKVQAILRDFVGREDVIGPGGQIHSFEAVFGPRGENGAPVRLFDRKTGEIDRSVLEAWRRYDIVEKLEREWKTLGPKLAGKITVIMGDQDNFYLEGAVRVLKTTVERLGSDARVIIEPDRDHGSIMRTKSFRRMTEEMCDRFLAAEKAAATSREGSDRKAPKGRASGSAGSGDGRASGRRPEAA